MSSASAGDELRVMAALHRVGADLGEPVEVVRDGASVVVSGAGLSQEIQNRIREALSELPHVVLRFSEAGTVPLEASTARPEVSSPQATGVPSRLAEQLGGRAQFENFSSQLLDRIDAAMTRVYALRRLAREFPVTAERQLTAAERALLYQMGREHVVAVRREVGALHGTLAPALTVLGAPEAQVAAGSSAASWQESAEDLFRSGRQVETLLAALVGAATSDLPAAGLPQQLAARLALLQHNVQQCERLLEP